MKLRSIILAICIVVLLVGGAYLLLSADIVEAPTVTSTIVEESDLDRLSEPESLSVTRTFSKGVHTIRGKVTKPTPCHTLSATVSTSSSNRTEALLSLSVTAGVEDMCIQILDEEEFAVTVRIDEEITLTGELNGKPIIITETTAL